MWRRYVHIKKKKKQHKSDEKLEMVTRKELCRTGAGVPQP